MNQRQDAKLNMLMGLRDYLNQNSPIVATIPNLNGLLIVLQNLINQIQSASLLQNMNKSGVRINKNELRQNLVIVGADVSRRIAAYATMINNDTLLNEVQFSDYELNRLADIRLKETVQVIYDRGLAYVTNVANYGLNNQMLASLLNALNAFNTAIPKPRLTVTEKKQATDQLIVLFKEADALLVKIDVLVDIVKLNQPVFHGGYKSMRMLIDRGIRKRMLTISIIDNTNKEPIKGAICQLTLNDQMIIKKSSNKGQFYVQTLSEGVYRLSVSKSGFSEKSIDVIAYKNESKKYDVFLERL